MTLAVLDTNVHLQSLIGSPMAASAKVLEAYFAGQFQIAFSEKTIDELLSVLSMPSIRKQLGRTDDEVLDYLCAVTATAIVLKHVDSQGITADIPRDISDVKFLALAVAVGADFIVTNDRRHLIPLKIFRGIPIVLPAEFLARLA